MVIVLVFLYSFHLTKFTLTHALQASKSTVTQSYIVPIAGVIPQQEHLAGVQSVNVNTQLLLHLSLKSSATTCYTSKKKERPRRTRGWPCLSPLNPFRLPSFLHLSLSRDTDYTAFPLSMCPSFCARFSYLAHHIAAFLLDCSLSLAPRIIRLWITPHYPTLQLSTTHSYAKFFLPCHPVVRVKRSV